MYNSFYLFIPTQFHTIYWIAPKEQVVGCFHLEPTVSGHISLMTFMQAKFLLQCLHSPLDAGLHGNNTVFPCF